MQIEKLKTLGWLLMFLWCLLLLAAAITLPIGPDNNVGYKRFHVGFVIFGIAASICCIFLVLIGEILYQIYILFH